MTQSAVLIINGSVNAEFVAEYLDQMNQQLPIYCTDGAFNQVSSTSRIVNNLKAVIGDCDSLEKQCFKQAYPEIALIEQINQDSTDFDKALSYLSRWYQTIYIFGFSGGEIDHCLGNISTVMRWYQTLNLTLIDEYCWGFISDKNICLTNVLGHMVSVVPLFSVHNVTYSGLKYHLQNEDLNFVTKLGTRNYAIANDITIRFSQGVVMTLISHDLYQHYMEE